MPHPIAGQYSRGRNLLSLAVGLCALLSGCQQHMAYQPSYRGLEETDFFEDKRAVRPPVNGTVARGELRDDSHLYTGKRSANARLGVLAAAIGRAVSQQPGDVLAALTTANLSEGTFELAGFYDSFPMPIDEKVLKRGEERFNIYCAVCHARTGLGNGMIVQRGYLKPPNFHSDNSRGLAYRGVTVTLKDAPVGYYFQVISRGYGGMPEHATQVPVKDRWAIIAYIRALQASYLPVNQLTPEQRELLEKKDHGDHGKAHNGGHH